MVDASNNNLPGLDIPGKLDDLQPKGCLFDNGTVGWVSNDGFCNHTGHHCKKTSKI
jgi:hypothetical protein